MKESFADLNGNGKRALRKEKIQTALVNCLFDGPGFGIGKAPLCNCSHVLGVKVWFGGQNVRLLCLHQSRQKGASLLVIGDSV